ncbi:MAG: hypothetical protein IJ168_10895 [Eubacterium sp.]|nr:hypothetical protein [Eubacterium sp.]
MLFVQRLLGSAVVKHLLDFLIAVAWGLAYVCCLIAYAGGSFRGEYLLLCGGGVVIYLITIHRVINPVLLFITKPFQRLRAQLRKKLKKSKKRFKKVLHFSK